MHDKRWQFIFTLIRLAVASSSLQHLQNVIAKIKEDHDTFNKEIRMYHDEGSAMSKVKAKMIIPMRDQLEHVYGLTGHAKGGWN